jgi:hypothetical protein
MPSQPCLQETSRKNLNLKKVVRLRNFLKFTKPFSQILAFFIDVLDHVEENEDEEDEEVQLVSSANFNPGNFLQNSSFFNQLF